MLNVTEMNVVIVCCRIFYGVCAQRYASLIAVESLSASLAPLSH